MDSIGGQCWRDDTCTFSSRLEQAIWASFLISFKEYLASVEIKESNNEARLTSAIKSPDQRSWWVETMRLYCVQNDANSIIQAAYRSENIDTLSLAFYCLARLYPLSRVAK